MLGRPAAVVLAWARAPSLHFLALGALLFAFTARDGGPAARPPIVISAERVADIRDDYQRTVRTVPTPAELDALIAVRQFVADTYGAEYLPDEPNTYPRSYPRE